MSLAAAVLCSLGVGSALIAETGNISLEMLMIRPDMLGDYMNSPLAVVFNLSLLAGGSCLLLAMVAVFNTYYYCNRKNVPFKFSTKFAAFNSTISSHFLSYTLPKLFVHLS